ncbi:hypothetical protein PYW08_005390 [Mythimna loreyi]|uniref:Uncharacterized protein n=1 Tax=Mythimna loreyi TaxID=667449 RepID=A0ACC2QIG7_9NEOP|nr:hypothetical protein PYW08_005390 [Mythimna loreyi]
MFGPFLLLVLVQSSTAIISSHNDTEHFRMPPLFHLDGYEDCFDEPDALFCYGEFALVSDEPSEFLTAIQKYSASVKHYNHTLLRYGYCMKKTCNEFYNGSKSEVDLRLSFEACSNKTIYDKYMLKTRLTDELDCSKRDRDLPIDYLDIFVGGVCILIIVANIIGSLCDHYLDKKRDRGALKLLYGFSIKRNWKKFIAPAGKGQDPRIKALKGIHGIRAITISAVVIAHALYSTMILNVNPELIESFYDIKFFNMFMNGSLVMQTFFVTSAFLLVYNALIYAEKHTPSWSMLPYQIIMRWLRLTPSYALIIGLTVTWFKRITSGGPIWAKTIYYEARDCRQEWWKHLLYINNYVERTHCMAQTWYLAADTQLYIFALILFLICKTNLRRKIILSLVFVVGLIIPVLHTYYEGLTGIIIASPDMGVNMFFGDPTFHKILIRAHTNLPGCIIGMALGYIVYNWQKAGGDPQQLRKYRYIYYCTPIFGALVCFSGYIFFTDGPPLPTYVHMLYAGLQKPAFGLAVAIIIAGIIIQFEDVFRPILEWRPFTYIGRLSYSIYLIHIAFIRAGLASITYLQRNSMVKTMIDDTTILLGIYISSFFFCLMVEMPSANLVSTLFKRPQTKESIEESKKAENDNAIDMTETKTEDGTTVVKMGPTT